MRTADQSKIQTAKSEGKTMTKNKKFLKYNELLEETAKIELELRSIQARKEELRKEQSEIILDKLKSFQTISQSVFRKYFPDSSSITFEESRKMLKEQAWIFDVIQLKDAKLESINLSKMKYRYSNTGKSGWEEESTATVSRNLLHMSDRDFAKLIRQKIRTWKQLQKDEAEAKLKAELKKAEREAKLAAKKLDEIMAQQAKLQEDAEDKRVRQAAYRARARAGVS